MFRYVALILVYIAAGLTALADDMATASGDYTFYGEDHHSLSDCKRLALEGARISALKDKYGTTVSNDTYSRATNEGSEYFSSLSATEVRGEWIADIGKPEYDVNLDDEGHYVVRCRVKGNVRPLGNEAVAFEAVALRGSDQIEARTTSFVSGDELRLHFMAPIDGYVAVFLADDADNVYRLLPYSRDGKGEVRTRHGKNYVFFSESRPDGVDDESVVDGLILSTDREVERNELYVVFSPRPFSSPGAVTTEGVPANLSLNAFNRWLSDSRRRDSRMGVRRIGLEITAK